MPKIMKGGIEYPLPPANNASNIAYKNGTVESALDSLGFVGDYIRIYPSASENLTKSYSVLDYTALAGKRGETFQHNSDGTVTVLRKCCAIVHASVYFGIGFTAGDWICGAIYVNGSVKVRTGDTVHAASPYKTITCTYTALLEAGDIISVRAMNDGGARGVISNTPECSFLSVMALN